MSDISITLIRHGEAAGSWSENLDPGLSVNGIDQAKSLSLDNTNDYLKDYDFISSPRLRAIETSHFLARKFNKKVKINDIFDEIPSEGIKLEDKIDWLKKISSMPFKDLPNSVIDWQERIIKEILSFKQNSVIFSHFMVMNIVFGYINSSSKLLSFYPDYTSSIKVTLKDNEITSYQIDKEKKTKINL